ncbi:MAG: hypothetical protein FD138_2661, partial [Planctomycetota bacterium]
MSGKPTKDLISVTCAECGASFKVDARHAGKRGRCPVAECQAAATTFERAMERNYASAMKRPVDSPKRLPRAKKSKRSARSIAQRLWPLWSACGIGAALLIGVVLWGTGAVEPQRVEAAKADTYQQQIAPFVKKYCVECHGSDSSEGGIALHNFDSEKSVQKSRKVWEKVLPMLQIEAMPPVEDGRERPTHDEFLAVTSWLEDKLFNIDCKLERDPGRVTVRRLNRTEYNNT